ncbi:uncharacterized protein LOC103710580 isoform X2 [Phoenix dactylifera]|uniref:Uncharacterized protein LOC103710580 isoform X2 n=1 Tax=Phoenix dactylifera TaxID=42345 RepID=A0A8B8J6H6_PHODC|nr:uncharacterized protein LOC103710580 isoform X2 [Phoenix dactylifera]
MFVLQNSIASTIMMKLSNCGSLPKDPAYKRQCFCNLISAAALLCIVFFMGSAFVAIDIKEKVSTWGAANSVQNSQTNLETKRNLETTKSSLCESQWKPAGSEPLPKGIISQTSNFEMQPLWGSPERKVKTKHSKSLLAIPVGIKQKGAVSQIVEKFPSNNFTVMLFHYDGVVDEWSDVRWSDSALHISAINQTKWWFAKRFLHPDVVAEYNYIFLWDEDLEVENFHPLRYLSIIKREGLEISQPALDTAKSAVHHGITARWRKGDVHRRIYKLGGGGRCYENSTTPPCTGWVEMMAPVFSRDAWRCTWHMIQNDLVHAWGLDTKLGYCAQGDRSKNVGVVDSEYIVHRGIPTLGGLDEKKRNADSASGASQTKPSNLEKKVHHGSSTSKDRSAVRKRSYFELNLFRKRWQKAVIEDKCWVDPYS